MSGKLDQMRALGFRGRASRSAVNKPAPAVNKQGVSTSSTTAAGASRREPPSYAKQRVDPDKRRAYMREYMRQRRLHN